MTELEFELVPALQRGLMHDTGVEVSKIWDSKRHSGGHKAKMRQWRVLFMDFQVCEPESREV